MILSHNANKKRSRLSSNSKPKETFPATNRVPAFFLFCLSLLCVVGNANGLEVGHGAMSGAASASAALDQQRQQSTERELQNFATGRPTLIESGTCIPRNVIEDIHLDPFDERLPITAGNEIDIDCYKKENYCGSNDGSSPSGCCRISFSAGWVVCDRYNAFDHMTCVCNDNTEGSPTPQPTTQAPTIFRSTEVPSKDPSVGPTMTPTMTPTQDPSKDPSVSPTKGPTTEPTTEPTKEPTKEPTTEPTTEPAKEPTTEPTTEPTKEPTTEPTKEPTTEPTATPIVSTDSPTTKEPTASPVETSLTGSPTTKPSVAPVPLATESPTAEPTKTPTQGPTAAPTEAPTNAPLSSTEDKFDSDLGAKIRQSQCKEDPPVIDFVQGSTFVYRYEVTLPTNDAEETFDSKIQKLSEAWTRDIHDEMAKEFLLCGSDGEEIYRYDTVWILQSKTHEVDEEAQCSDEDSNDADSEKCVVMKAESRIIAYQSPLGKKIRQTWSGTDAYGSGPVADGFAQDAIGFVDSLISGGQLEDSSSATVSFQGAEIVADGDATGNEDGEGLDGNDEEDGGSDTDGNVNQETGGDTETGGDEDGNSDNTAAGIEGSVNSNNNKKGLTPPIIATIAVLAGFVLLLILMAASRRRRREDKQEDEEYLKNADIEQKDSMQYAMGAINHLELSDSDDGDVPGPIVRSDLDLEENYSKEEPQQYFYFSGSVSPSSRQRSEMGPLGVSDEFWEGQSTSTSKTDGRKANHRGVSSPSSLSTGSRIPSPLQNSSPRNYQLRDTVKL